MSILIIGEIGFYNKKKKIGLIFGHNDRMYHFREEDIEQLAPEKIEGQEVFFEERKSVVGEKTSDNIFFAHKIKNKIMMNIKEIGNNG